MAFAKERIQPLVGVLGLENWMFWDIDLTMGLRLLSKLGRSIFIVPDNFIQ